MAMPSSLAAPSHLPPNRLETVAKTGLNHHSSPESVQQALLEQLRDVEGLDSMSAEELAADLEALQLAALCGLDEGMAAKPLGSQTEEFLVSQVGKGVCQRCVPRG